MGQVLRECLIKTAPSRQWARTSAFPESQSPRGVARNARSRAGRHCKHLRNGTDFFALPVVTTVGASHAEDCGSALTVLAKAASTTS